MYSLFILALLGLTRLSRLLRFNVELFLLKGEDLAFEGFRGSDFLRKLILWFLGDRAILQPSYENAGQSQAAKPMEVCVPTEHVVSIEANAPTFRDASRYVVGTVVVVNYQRVNRRVF